MASYAYEPSSLAERTDIHKSCKSLETLLNVLNDYCEAIGHACALQKKLAKALRETAGMKITGDIPGNAMNASAAVFEALSDIDTKFAKVADKEYDGISTEVKKWFKKLAKEEKVHDERMSNANAKIKQAGQIYEKKSKKGARDINEEHTRYINLISALGPEMSQEKYDHALSITQRHTSTTYSAAACLSRIADAEWLRAFEGVRRFSPVIGQLREWHALCEGGWIGPIPERLPDLDEHGRLQADRELETERRPEDEELQPPTTLRDLEAQEPFRETRKQNSPQPRNIITPGPERSQGPLPSPRQSPAISRPSQPYPSSESVAQDRFTPSSLDPSPPRPFADSNTGSVRSLSAFPAPPTHFPPPPPSPRQQQSSQSQSSQSSSHLKPRLTESPIPGESSGHAEISSPSLEPHHSSPSTQQKFRSRYPIANSTSASPLVDKANHPILDGTQMPLSSAPSYAHVEASTLPGGFNSRSPAHAQGDYSDGLAQREFGVNLGHRPKARTMDNIKSDYIERSDTSGSNSSLVTAMRHRYSIAAGSMSAAPNDVPRLPLSVNDLASRYQPVDEPSSPRPGPSPPPRQLPTVPSVPGTLPRQSGSQQERVLPGNYSLEPSSSDANATPAQDDEVSRWRRQGHEELEEPELKPNQMELRERQHEIEMRARGLERDRLRSMNAGAEDGHTNIDQVRGNPSPQLQPLRPLQQRSQMDSANVPNNFAPLSPVRPRYSQSATHLVPSTSSPHALTPPDSRSAYLHSSSSSRQSSQQPEDKPPHAPSCGCETCSIVKYRSPPPRQPLDLRPPTKPLTLRPVEKSKPGWIRRLSVPVGNAFGLDSKKGLGSFGGLGSGKNGSTTSLGPEIHQERRSYEASAMSVNRSMTNLGMG